jgi:hypothetical protein
VAQALGLRACWTAARNACVPQTPPIRAINLNLIIWSNLDDLWLITESFDEMVNPLMQITMLRPARDY